MNDRLEALEREARRLEPDAEQRARWLRAVTAYAEDFLEGLADRPAYRAGDVASVSELFRPFGERPTDIAELLGTLERDVDAPGIQVASAGHLAYIPSGGLYPAALGDLLADIANRYAGVFFAAPGAVRLEKQLVDWMAELIGYPAASAGGDLTSGGSIASLSAIVAAREAHGVRAADLSRRVVYVTEQAHHSLRKALRIAGLEECVRRTVAVDARWRMDPDALVRAVRVDRQAGRLPWLLIANGGSTDVGAVDPLGALADIAVEHRLWMHVDAAYGGAFLLCEEGQRALQGIARSDSTVIDPHKGMFVPFGTGAVLVRDRQRLVHAFSDRANYMQDAIGPGFELSPAELSPELSRPFRGLRLWLPLKLFGLAPYRAALEEKLLLARWFHRRLSQTPGFEVGPEPELSVVVYRYLPKRGDPDAFNRRLLEALLGDGRICLSSTRLDGRFTLRLAVLNYRTHLAEVALAAELLEHHARVIERSD